MSEMDASLEKSCLEEISHTVLDSQQKISVRSISNNYGVKFLDAVNILQQWIDKNGTKANLVKEFIVRGFDPKRGGAFITVVNEKKLKVVQSKASRISSVLYAVEVAAESSRKLVIPEEQEFKVINLPLQSDKRDVQVFTPAANPPPVAVTTVKPEPKSKINSMFAAGASKPKQEPPKSATVKEEKQSPPAATGKKDTAKATSPQKTPSKGSPSKKKDAKKAVSGKASIASFFSNKPGASKLAPVASAGSSAAVAAEVKKEKESPKEAKEPKKEEKMTNGKQREDTPRWKRMISDESDGDDVIPNTPQAKKEPIKKGGRKTQALKKAGTSKTNPSKRTRILQVVDSSEEEEEDEARNLREPEERLIKFDVEESEDADMKNDEDEEGKQKKKDQKLSPEKPVENDSNSLNRKRAKVKKLVTKNFMDDEGYMTTVKEYVMVSASEDEDGDASNNSAAEGKKATAEKETVASGGGDKNSKSDAKSASKKPSKISVRSISNNYGVKFLDAVNILQQWIDKNGTKANLVKEFIVRGFDPKRGGAFITVVNEKKLKVVQSKASRISSVLYAVEVAAESSRKLVIPEEQEFKVINLPLQSDKRDVQVFTPAANPPPVAVTTVKPEPKSKINSMFAAGASKPKQEPPKSATVKEEKQSPPAATGKKDTAKATSPQKTPSKGSPSKKKDAKKAVSGKASIASFFSNKPGASKLAPVASAGSSAAVAAEVKKEKESPKEAKEPKKEEKMTNGKQREDTPRWKRMISDESDGDDVIPNTPQAKKEPIKKGGRKTQALKKAGTSKTNPSKRTRILQVVDSSEEEEEDEARNLREPEERLIKFDVEESEDADMKNDEDEEGKQKKKDQKLSPEKPVENDSNSLNRKRAKVKKLVTKNFMDDEGYMTTVKEYVMVSASEDEDGDASNNSAAEGKKATAEKETVASGGGDKNSKSDAKSASKKPSKVTPPTPKTKQGSIMSFFSKK